MRRSRRPIVIASRRSPLAQRQAQLIGMVLDRLNLHVSVEYQWFESEGDRLSGASVSDSGGKGLFARAIEEVVLAGRADIAVHSLKDLPSVGSTDGLTIVAVPERADFRDCLVARNGAKSIDQLPHAAVVGTSSPRRAAELRRIRSDLQIEPLRGNLQTRLQKVLEAHECDATLVAVAGLRRCGLDKHAETPIDPSVILPAAAQGALAVQCRSDDHTTIRRCLPLNDPVTAAAVHTERHVMAALGGDCHSPIAALCEPVGEGGVDGFRLRARVLSPDGLQHLEMDDRSSAKELSKCARKTAITLLERGASRLMFGHSSHEASV